MEDLRELLVMSISRKSFETLSEKGFINLDPGRTLPFCLYIAFHEVDNQGQIRYLARIIREDIIDRDGEEITRVHLGQMVPIPYLLTLTDRKGLWELTTFEKLLVASDVDELFADPEEGELMYVKLSPEFHDEFNLPELVPIFGLDPEALKSRGSIPMDALVKGMERILVTEPNHIHRDRFRSFLAKAFIGMGVSLAMEERYDEAVWQLRKALKLEPANAEARFHLANVFFDSDEPEKALLEYRESIRRDPDSSRARTYMGIALASLGRYQEALDEWKKVIVLKHDENEDLDNFMLVNMGKANLNLDRFSEAERLFKQAILLDPENIPARNHLGITLANLGKLQQAIDIWYGIMGKQEQDSFLFFNLGRALYNIGNYPKAIYFMTMAEQSIEEPEVQAAIPLIIESATVKAKQAAEASIKPSWRKQHFEKYYREKFGLEVIGYTADVRRKMSPQLLEELMTELGGTMLDLMRCVVFSPGKDAPDVTFDQESGCIEFTGRITAKNTPELHQRTHKLLAHIISPKQAGTASDIKQQRDHEGNKNAAAMEKLKQRIIKNPSDEWAHYNLGAVLVQQNELGEALKCFEKAVSLNSNNAMALHALGLIHSRLGSLEEAIKAFQQAIIAVPDSNLTEAYERWGYKDSLAYFDLGDVLMKKQMYDEAIVSFRKGLEVDASVPLAHYQIGISLLMKELHNEAAEAFRNAILLNSGFSPAYNRLGLALMRLEKFDEARDSYEQALELNPGDVESLFFLGQIALINKDSDKATHLLQKVIDLAPETRYATKARQILDKIDRR